MSNNLDYKQKYLEYKIKYINKKTDIQTGGMHAADDTAAADVLPYPKNKQQLQSLIDEDDSLSTVEFYNRHFKVLPHIPKSIFQKAEQIFIAGVFLNKLTSISTLHIPQLSNNNDGIVMAFYLAVVGDQTFGQSIREQLNPGFRYPVREKVVTDPADRKDLFLARETELRKKPLHPSVDHVAGQEEPSIDPAAVQDTSMDEDIARGYQERDQAIQRSRDFHTMRLGRSQAHAFDPSRFEAHAFDPSRLGRVQAHASPSRFEAHAYPSSFEAHASPSRFEARTVDPLHFLATAMQKPTPHTAAATPAPSFRIPEDLRQRLEIIKTPDDEQNFIRAYKRFYQKNLGDRERIIEDLVRYGIDFYRTRLNIKWLERFMGWFQENVRPFDPERVISKKLKLEQMAEILKKVETNTGLPEFEYTNPITEQQITVASDIFMDVLKFRGDDDDTKLRLYGILFETPESSVDPSIAEGIDRDRKVARNLQTQGSQQARGFHEMGLGDVQALDLDDYAEAEGFGEEDEEI